MNTPLIQKSSIDPAKLSIAIDNEDKSICKPSLMAISFQVNGQYLGRLC